MRSKRLPISSSGKRHQAGSSDAARGSHELGERILDIEDEASRGRWGEGHRRRSGGEPAIFYWQHRPPSRLCRVATSTSFVPRAPSGFIDESGDPGFRLKKVINAGICRRIGDLRPFNFCISAIVTKKRS